MARGCSKDKIQLWQVRLKRKRSHLRRPPLEDVPVKAETNEQAAKWTALMRDARSDQAKGNIVES